MRLPVVLLAVSTATGAAIMSCGGTGTIPTTRDAGSDAGHGEDATAPEAAAPLAPLEARAPGLIPFSKRKDSVSTPVVFDTQRGGVWTANGDVGSVSYVDIDVGHQRLVQEIPVGTDVTSVAVSPDFKWVAAVDRGGAGVALIDPYRRRVSRLIKTGTHPRAAVWDAADPRWLYVALEDDDAVGVIDRTLGVYSGTVPVGRLPAGLAVSRLRRELYVSHRIDGKVTTLAIADREEASGGHDADSGPDSGVEARAARALLSFDRDVVVADQTPNADPKVPQGKPFAFEGMAWTADGNLMWLPHELFAPTHPFQFTETIFPAISVIDFTSGGGLEVWTNPNDPNGVIAGRKLLFGAINLPDAEGNTQIVSQPCAVATHPNGLVAYALACASEDFLVFDGTSGLATQILRNQPSAPFGAHPTGLTLDALGARAFVLSDQSHTLTTLDLAGGDVTLLVRPIAGPLSVITKDTVDPGLRAGLTLFYNANSSKYSLATTGDDWMSCGGCHLDGFVTTNQRLFEMAHVADPATDARIGHVGLKDLFSTSPEAASSSFDPHDVLVALTDQGGLAPDRTGQDRTGAVDPGAPTAAAKTMAADLARVVARDLPIGPSWLLSDAKPDPSYDGGWCGNCHAAEYAAWKQSAHAHSGADKMVTFCDGVEKSASGAEFGRLCAGCHDPVSSRLGDTTLTSGRGITCLGCHDTVRTIRAGGNADLETNAHDWTAAHKASASAGLALLRTPGFCGGCHQQFVPGTGLAGIETLSEWEAGPFGSGLIESPCINCHMTVTAGVADHSFPGGNVYLAMTYGETELASRETANLRGAFALAATKQADGTVSVALTNTASGHKFPTGVTDIREPWIELQAVDAKGNALAHYGGVGPDGLLPAGAARLGIDIADSNGTLLTKHELSLAARIPFDVRVSPKQSMSFSIPAPSALPSGAAGLDAVLLFHNLRTTYYRAATGDATASTPAIEVSRVHVH